MFAFALRRLLHAVPSLFVLLTLAFFMMRAAPGGPFDSERSLPPQIEAALREYTVPERSFSFVWTHNEEQTLV